MAPVFLSHAEVRAREPLIRSELAVLLASASLVGRPGAAQWRFFQAAVLALFGEPPPLDLRSLTPRRAAQLKFEVEDRLRRYYLNPGRPVGLVFGLVHAATLARQELSHDLIAPAVSGYVARIRDIGEDLLSPCGPRELRSLLEAVVSDAIDAEFAAYRALPEIDEDTLALHFVRDGPAWLGVMHVLSRHQQRGWTLTNPLNPSTKRLLSVDIRDIEQGSASARTSEYFYLRWWDTTRGKYAYAYRELNKQQYVLETGDDGRWRVLDNLRPSPRWTPPNRRIRQPPKS